MPNFDSLRAASLQIMTYLCRPIEKPHDLIGLFTLGDGNTTDLSNYGGTHNYSYTPVNTVEYGFPLSTYTTTNGAMTNTFILGKSLNLGEDWSIEGYFKDPSGRAYSYFSIGGLDYVAGSGKSGDSGDYASIFSGTTRLAGAGSWRNPKGILHRAIQYTASDTTIRLYKNGVVQSSLVRDLSGTQISTFTWTFVGSGFGDGENVRGIGNVRIVQKALGTSTTFPTPSSLYTGYETL